MVHSLQLWFRFLWQTAFSSVQFSHSVVSNSLQPHGLQHARPPCPSPTPRAYSNSCPLSRWCHPTISSSVVPFSSCLPSFPASASFQMSQFFTSGGQSTGVSASTSVLLMNIQDWFPLGFLTFHTVHGVLKAKRPKWLAIPFSSGPRFVRTWHGSCGCGPCDQFD